MLGINLCIVPRIKIFFGAECGLDWNTDFFRRFFKLVNGKRDRIKRFGRRIENTSI